VAITPLGYADHSDYGARGVKLVYGELADGSLVRVDRLAPRSKPTLICPVCRKDVHAVRRTGAQLFFRHTTGAPGCGGPETNAHIWAKDQLQAARTVWLPPVMSSFPGVDQELKAAQWVTLADVELEPTRGDLRPDLAVQVVNSKGKLHELWIEIHVTNPCKPAKIDKIRARSQTTIEIDLSAYRTSHDVAAIRRALLEGLNRAWLHHKAIEDDLVAREALAAQERDREAAKIRRTAERLVSASRGVALSTPPPSLQSIRAKIEAFDLGDVIGLPTAPSGFVVSSHYWQAALWDRWVVLRMEAEQPTPILKPINALRALADCLPPPLRDFVPSDVLRAAREIDPGFVAPQEAIHQYIKALTQARVLIARDFPDWCLAHDRALVLQRRINQLRRVLDRSEHVTKRIEALLERLAAPVEFDVAAWLRRPGLDGRSPYQSMGGGEEAWQAFDGALQAIEQMAAGWRPTRNLMGLPLEPMREAAEERQRQEAAAAARYKAEAEAKAAGDRVNHLKREAVAELGDEGAAWLDGLLLDGRPAKDLAAESAQGLSRGIQAVWQHAREVEAQAKRARKYALNLTELKRRIFQVYDDLHGGVFMNTSQPKLGGVAPKKAAETDAGLRAALNLLPRKPQRRTH